MDLSAFSTQLQAAFPDASVGALRVLGEGFGSLVVESSSGLVFRVGKTPVAQRGHRRERRMLPIVASHASSLLVPRVDYFLDASAAFPYGVMGYRKLPGRPLSRLDLTRETRPRIASQIAAFLSGLHGIETAQFDAADLPRFPPERAQLEALWATVAGYVERHLRRSEYEGIRRWHETMLDYHRRFPYMPVLVHGDLWYENIIVDPEQQRLVGVVDFEGVALGDAAIDLATQRYLGRPFAQDVIAAYYRRRAPDDLAARIANLLALRELVGLEHGLLTGDIDPDSLEKVRQSIHASPMAS